MANKLVEQTLTFHVEHAVSDLEYDRYKDEPNWQDAMRNSAGRRLADAILKQAGEMTIIDDRSEAQKAVPEIDRYFDHGRVYYRWTVRVVMPGPLKNWFAEQEKAQALQGRIDGLIRARELIMNASAAEERVGHGQAAYHMKLVGNDLAGEVYKLERELDALPNTELTNVEGR